MGVTVASGVGVCMPLEFPSHWLLGGWAPSGCKWLGTPGTQMTLVLNGKGLLLEGSNPKIEDKQVPGIFSMQSRHIWKGINPA